MKKLPNHRSINVFLHEDVISELEKIATRYNATKTKLIRWIINSYLLDEKDKHR